MQTKFENRFTYYFTQAFKIMFMVLAFSLIAGGVVMWLWNALIPDIFGLTTIGFWQAIGLIVLSKILFSGFGGSGGSKRHNGQHWGRRWSQMNATDQQAFKEKLRNRYCGDVDEIVEDDRKKESND